MIVIVREAFKAIPHGLPKSESSHEGMSIAMTLALHPMHFNRLWVNILQGFTSEDRWSLFFEI
jgi:hypothetical protein